MSVNPRAAEAASDGPVAPRREESGPQVAEARSEARTGQPSLRQSFEQFLQDLTAPGRTPGELHPFSRLPALPDTGGPHVPRMDVQSNGTSIARTHTVRDGDSLWSIAKGELQRNHMNASNRDVHDYVNHIVKSNAEKHPDLARNPNRIHNGAELLIPTPPPHRESPAGQQPGGRESTRVRDRGREPSSVRPGEEGAGERPQPHSRPARPGRPGRPEGEPEAPATGDRTRRPGRIEPGEYTDPTPERTTSADGRYHVGQKIENALSSIYSTGSQTANGERFNPNRTEPMVTIAHKHLPFGTVLQLERNGRTILAEVTDRGPFVKGREFDLTPPGARALGISHDAGLGRVNATIVHMGKGGYHPPGWYAKGNRSMYE